MSRLCPRCQAALQARSSGGVEVDLCPDCGGVFLDEGEFDRLIAERFIGNRMESTFAFVAVEVEDPIACSACAESMHRTEFDEVELDRCPACGGIWLDGHERCGFAERAAEAARNPEPEATVPCGGCGKEELQRLCIRRMDQFWCEACVVAGNHPGPEAQLVGTRDRIASAARLMANAKMDQDHARETTKSRKRRTERSHRRFGRQAYAAPAFLDAVESVSRGVLGIFRKRDH